MKLFVLMFVCLGLFSQTQACGRDWDDFWKTLGPDARGGDTARSIVPTVPQQSIDPPEQNMIVTPELLQQLEELESSVPYCRDDAGREYVSENIRFKFKTCKTLTLSFQEISSEMLGKHLLKILFTYTWPAHLPVMQDEQGFALVSEVVLDVFHINDEKDLEAIQPELANREQLPLLRMGQQVYYRIISPSMTQETVYVSVYENLLFRFTCKSFPSTLLDLEMQRDVDEAFIMVIRTLEVF